MEATFPSSSIRPSICAQARLFNDPSSAQEVLVASDAIGMGLNLNIHRVVFASLTKFDGQVTHTTTPDPTRTRRVLASRLRACLCHPRLA